jgi:hypothetical protein
MQRRVSLWLVEMEELEVWEESEVTVLRVQITRVASGELEVPVVLVRLRLPHQYRREDLLVKMFWELLRQATQKRGRSRRRVVRVAQPHLVEPAVREQEQHYRELAVLDLTAEPAVLCMWEDWLGIRPVLLKLLRIQKQHLWRLVARVQMVRMVSRHLQVRV